MAKDISINICRYESFEAMSAFLRRVGFLLDFILGLWISKFGRRWGGLERFIPLHDTIDVHSIILFVRRVGLD
jgi:hypothetical protein